MTSYEVTYLIRYQQNVRQGATRYTNTDNINDS